MERGEESSLALEKLPGRHLAATGSPLTEQPCRGGLAGSHVARPGWRRDALR